MAFEPSSRKAPNRVQRLAQRAAYDEESVYAAIDRAAICHATFRLPQSEDAQSDADDWPTIIPMIFGRRIYLHGHLSSRLLKVLSDDGEVKACLAFTNVDGVVVAMSPFHSSMNYESAVLYGLTRFISDPTEKNDALTRITNHSFRAPDGTEGDRWTLSRETSEVELKSTRVIAFDIEMASAKIRRGGPNDEKEDIEGYASKYWTGVIHKREQFYQAEPSSYNKAPLPDYIEKMLS
ncbi:hypothetical protein EMMF5_002281 [Cystobasidiomycetes sp. EMM_F5]